MIISAIIAVAVVYSTKKARGDASEVIYNTYLPTPQPTTYRNISGIKEIIEANVLQRNTTFDGMGQK